MTRLPRVKACESSIARDFSLSDLVAVISDCETPKAERRQSPFTQVRSSRKH